MTLIPELWSDADRQAERELVQATIGGDLLGVLLAIEGASDEDEARARAWIAERGERVRELAQTEPPVDALVTALVQESALLGDASDYYAADNSRLTRVIVRRTGQPILLSSVWVLVARAAGITVHGVGLPGHFVVRVGDAIVDPFAGGATLTQAQCEALARRAMPGRTFDPAWLDTTPLGGIAVRVLRNLVNACQQNDEVAAAYRALRLLTGLAPDNAPVHLELARLTELHGAWPEALTMYRDIVTRFADRREAQIAELKLVELERQTRTLN